MTKIGEMALDEHHAKRLAKDICSTLLSWNNREDALRAFTQEVERVYGLIDKHPNSASQDRYKTEWTAAIYVYFEYLAKDSSRIGCPPYVWTVCPPDKPYKDEFLTDFAIWEHGYGLRIACESQWHEGKNNENRVASALDKLLHVKADIKVLSFEDPHEVGDLRGRLREKFLTNYLRFHTPEHYVFVQWDGNKAKCYSWCPTASTSPELIPI